MIRPPSLYKYQALTLQVLENLTNGVLYFSSPLGFNDPYDCDTAPRLLPLTPEQTAVYRRDLHGQNGCPHHGLAQLSDEALASVMTSSATKVLQSKCAEYRDTLGVTCFSERNDNPLMWSHYSDSHRGICLEFATSATFFERLFKVRYSAEIPEIDPFSLLDAPSPEQRPDPVLAALLASKELAWSYEREWRLVHKEANRAYHYPWDALVGVYFGERSSETSRRIVRLLAQKHKGVRYWLGSRSSSEYRIEFTRLPNPLP